MSEEELGRLSTKELGSLLVRSTERGWTTPILPCPGNADEIRAEHAERLRCFRRGKPGVSPLLSRRVVRAVIGTSYVAARERGQRCSEMGNMHGAQYEAGFAAGMDFVARWLLALPLDAPSTLEDPE